MIIFPNAIFIHVPKTSGSSFEKMCLERHGRKKVGHIHNSAVDIAKGERDKWVFGFMRHPVLAEYSNYRYHKYSWKGNDSFTFTNWCRWRWKEEKDFADTFGINNKQKQHGWTFNIYPQAGYFCLEDGTNIANRIFRFEYETLANSYAEISNKLGLDCSISDYKSMAYHWGGGKEDYWLDIEDKAIDILQEVKAIDFDIWEKPGRIEPTFSYPGFKKYASSHPN